MSDRALVARYQEALRRIAALDLERNLGSRIARRALDEEVELRDCGVSTPVWIGTPGEGAGGYYANTYCTKVRGHEDEHGETNATR